jgi:hypothetical protein
MSQTAPFRLNRSALLLALVSAAFANEAGAAAGRVDFVSGAVSVAGSDGRERTLARGTELDNGDTVRTLDGRAQIRFTDGSYVSLQPNTEFAIKEYRYEGKTDGSERGFFALAKGAMRTVTGLVGRVNRDRYRITTPTATVGIRGTGGRIEVLLDGSTLIAGTSGIWTLTNPSGTLDIPAGTFGRAPAAPDQPPQRTSQGPDTAPAPLPIEPRPFTQGEQRTETGAPAGILAVNPLVTGGGYALRVAHTQYTPQVYSNDNANSVFDSVGRMTGTTAFKLEPGGSHADFGTDGILAWGRWIGPASLSTDTTDPVDYTANQGLHYVVGMPTPVMPTSGSATYSFLGATSPTYVSGSTAPGKFDGSITVTFGGSGNINGNFKVTMPDSTYSWAWQAATAAQFSASTNSVTGCTSNCSASVSGFFSGANAERIGVGYHVSDSQANRNILGAAAFQK